MLYLRQSISELHKNNPLHIPRVGTEIAVRGNIPYLRVEDVELDGRPLYISWGLFDVTGHLRCPDEDCYPENAIFALVSDFRNIQPVANATRFHVRDYKLIDLLNVRTMEEYLHTVSSKHRYDLKHTLNNSTPVSCRAAIWNEDTVLDFASRYKDDTFLSNWKYANLLNAAVHSVHSSSSGGECNVYMIQYGLPDVWTATPVGIALMIRSVVNGIHVHTKVCDIILPGFKKYITGKSATLALIDYLLRHKSEVRVDYLDIYGLTSTLSDPMYAYKTHLLNTDPVKSTVTCDNVRDSELVQSFFFPNN